MRSADIIAALEAARGEEKSQLLYALGSIGDDNANEYYKKLLKNPSRYLHYLCNAKCEAVSDYGADILENAVNVMTAAAETGIVSDPQKSMTERGVKQFDQRFLNELMWTSMNICAFKSSDKLLEQYEVIGKHSEQIRQFHMDIYDLMFSKNISPFLAKRASEWRKNCGENNFIFALNDMLICGITLNGDKFAEKISSLADKYPSVYSRAGLFADFVSNNTLAFEKYGKREFADAVFSLFSGIVFSHSKGYMLYSPIWYIGNKNKIYHSRTCIGNDIDIRWIRYLIDIAKDEKAVYTHFRSRAGIMLKSSYRHLSRLMLSVYSPENSEHKELFREYFTMSAKRFSNEEDFEGLELCGEYSFTEIIIGITENICIGNSTYRALYNAFNGISLERSEKLFLLDIVLEYIEKNDRGENKAQREAFFKEAQLFMDRKRPRIIK